jgi:uncharacterized protein (TIGR02145 family)
LGDSVSGDKLKETGTTHWTISYDKNINPTNESGFTALPGGYRDFKGAYTGCRHEGCWWSSTEYDEDDAWYQFIYLERSYVESIECRKFAGFSVRCVKDSL